MRIESYASQTLETLVQEPSSEKVNANHIEKYNFALLFQYEI
jgi:hypothetical protein